MTGFLYISSNNPCGLEYSHATLLRLAKGPLLLLRSYNLLILVMRSALVRSHFLLSKLLSVTSTTVAPQVARNSCLPFYPVTRRDVISEIIVKFCSVIDFQKNEKLCSRNMKSLRTLKELKVIHICLFLGLVLLYFEIVGASRPGCSNPVGLEGTAEDSQFSSYTHMVGWDAFMARLFHDHAWCSATNDIKLEFLQIDLGSVRHISCIATQGVRSWDPLFSSYVITFMIKYSNNGTTWFIYKGSGGSVQIFDGNNDTSTVRYNYFRDTIETRYLRIYPKTFYHRMCLRVELYDSNEQSAPAPTPQLTTGTSSVPTKASPSITINTHTLHSLISHVTESLTKGKAIETPEVSNTIPSSTDPFTKVESNKSVDPANGRKDNPVAYRDMTLKVVLVIVVAVIAILLRTLCLCCKNRSLRVR